MTLAVDMGLTADDFDRLQKRARAVEKRIFERRVENDIPSFFTKHTLELWNARSKIYATIDQHTSGRWALLRIRLGQLNTSPNADVIAFEDPADMTMFLMAYEQGRGL